MIKVWTIFSEVYVVQWKYWKLLYATEKYFFSVNDKIVHAHTHLLNLQWAGYVTDTKMHHMFLIQHQRMKV